jgi:hypothetical protein
MSPDCFWAPDEVVQSYLHDHQLRLLIQSYIDDGEWVVAESA